MAVLTGPDWHWSLLTTTSPASQSAIDDPSRYTLTFEPGHQVAIKADCKSGTGTYTTNGSAMTISAGALGKPSCPTDADASTFVGKLAEVGSYHLVDGRLALELKDDAGELRFTNGAAPATTLGS